MFIVTSTSVVLCPHGGPATLIPSITSVLVEGAPPILLDDPCFIAGCVFTLPGGVPSPCLTIQWLTGTACSLVGNLIVVTSVSQGICKSPVQAPQGPAIIASFQQRVLAQ